MKTLDFFATHPVFSLDEATSALAPRGQRAGTVERLKHHLATGRITLVTRGVYAVTPPGEQGVRFAPDPVLVAAAARVDAVFAYHSALELLGVAHSLWQQYTVFTASRRRPVEVGGATISFLDHPGPLRREGLRHLATRTVERQGRLVRVTGPERSLVESMRRPGLAGGLEEAVDSASGFAVLDLPLLEEVLTRYDLAGLWAAVGWFLERYQARFHVPEAVLKRLERHRPRAPQYLERGRRRGSLMRRWNLIVPGVVAEQGEPDER